MQPECYQRPARVPAGPETGAMCGAHRFGGTSPGRAVRMVDRRRVRLAWEYRVRLLCVYNSSVASQVAPRSHDVPGLCPCIGCATARHQGTAGSESARRRGEVRGPLEGRGRRLLRTRRSSGDGGEARRTCRVLRRAGGRTAAGRPGHPARVASPKLVIDLQRLAELPTHQAGPLARYAAAIQSQRGDYNGKILTIRSEDLRSLAVIYDMSAEDLTDQLMHWGVLPQGTELD